MKVIYVAGPYRSANEWGVVCNIRDAEQCALQIWSIPGAAALCPHKNTALLGGALPDEVWLSGDIEMMLRCDGVFAMQGWRSSAGAKKEIEAAYKANIPVFYSINEVREFVEGKYRRTAQRASKPE